MYGGIEVFSWDIQVFPHIVREGMQCYKVLQNPFVIVDVTEQRSNSATALALCGAISSSLLTG